MHKMTYEVKRSAVIRGFANRPVHAFPPESRLRVIARRAVLYPLDAAIAWLKIVLGMLRRLRNAVFHAFRER